MFLARGLVIAAPRSGSGKTVITLGLLAALRRRGVIVARFLAVLELYRHAAISFEQVEPLGELSISWTGHDFRDEDLVALGADYDHA